MNYIVLVSSTESAIQIKGDVNNDGELNIADLVTLQKWLLDVPETQLANWKAADLCKNDRIDVFDLILMRKEIIINNKES